MRYNVIITLLLCVSVAANIWQCNNNENTITNTNITSDTIYQDTGTHSITTKPVPYRIDSISYIHDTFFQKSDSDAIFKAFFYKLFYTDTVVNDSSMMIMYKLWISQNKVDSISFDYQNKRITSIHYFSNKKEVFIGSEISYVAKRLSWYATLSYKQQKWLYTASYDLLNRGVKIGVNYKIF